MIGRFPLWLVLFVWFCQRRTEPRITFVNYPMMLQTLNDMLLVLPIPTGKIDRWLIEKVIDWLDKEKDAIRRLSHIGVVMTGNIKNN